MANIKPLSLSAATDLLQRLAPGAIFTRLEALPGSYSNDTQVLHARSAQGEGLRFAVRRYADFGGYDLSLKALREAGALQLLYDHGIPAPKPLLLDPQGRILEQPGIVTAFVAGELLEVLPEPLANAEEMARLLARLHALPCDRTSLPFLLDARSEALWFLQRGHELPAEVRTIPNGEAFWKRLLELLPSVSDPSPGFVHLDYWPGNLLWRDGRICAVVDFEEAAYGDPAIDVAYCRMDLIIRGLPQAAEHFLQVYEAQAGKTLENLRFWELAAAMRPISAPEGWISESPARENFIEWLG